VRIPAGKTVDAKNEPAISFDGSIFGQGWLMAQEGALKIRT
jgi:hypothetical protein